LNCKAVFRAGSKDPNRETKEVGTLDEIRFAIPKGAERCEIFLVGVDDFFYDQRLVWLTRTLSASFSVVDEPAKPAKRRSATQRASNKEFIALQRIKELKKTVNPQFDLRILIRLCEELNQSWNGKSLFAVAALTRTILNHVPPLFGKKDFREVAGNGGRSFRASMSHLDKSAKKIADGHMHSTIRQREVLPTANQVDFSRELDVLLGEIVRRLGTVEKPTIS